MSYEIERIIDALQDLDRDAPSLSKDDLESRLSDLESATRDLLDLPWPELPAAIEALACDIHDLYTEV